MNERKTAASRRLHHWAAANHLVAVSTTNVARGRTRGHAATWQLRQPGLDGKVKRVQLDYTFANASMRRMVTKVTNRWFPGQAKWAREHFDHALQETTLRLKLEPRKEP